MPLKSGLTDKEFIDFLHCRVTALEFCIGAKDQFFAAWADSRISEEIDKDDSLTTAQKDKLKVLATEIKNKFSRKDI